MYKWEKTPCLETRDQEKEHIVFRLLQWDFRYYNGIDAYADLQIAFTFYKDIYAYVH